MIWQNNLLFFSQLLVEEVVLLSLDKDVLIIYALYPDTVEISTVVFTLLLYYLHKNSG